MHGIALILLWLLLGKFIFFNYSFFSMYGLVYESNFSALRTIRLLRPLRSINKVRGIRVIVEALLASLPPLGNVMLFLMFIIIL